MNLNFAELFVSKVQTSGTIFVHPINFYSEFSTCGVTFQFFVILVGG